MPIASRRSFSGHFVLLSAACFVIVGTQALDTAHAAAKTSPPNVVLIIADDQGWTDFGFMGSKVVRTPNLDRLAAEGAVFPRAYVPTSLCRPSLVTLMTGLFPHQHKVTGNDPPEGVDRSAMHHFIRDVPTVPRLLGQAGYRSLQTGKFWEGEYSKAGFTAGETNDIDRHIAARKQPQIGRDTMQPIYDFIEASGERPFFVWYAPMMPHTPHTPPVEILKPYMAQDRPLELAKYYAMCTWFDETCGQLLDYLDQKNLRENTIVVFVVDNGWIQPIAPQERRVKGAGPGQPKGKLSPFDGGVRTPVVIRWPGHTKPGRYDDLVSEIDIAPTILTACGVQPPAAMPGLSLLERADGGTALARKAVFGEIFVHTEIDIDRPERNVVQRWVHEGDWKLIKPVDPSKPAKLFNVTDDPSEDHDLAASNHAKVEELTALLDSWWSPAAN